MAGDGAGGLYIDRRSSSCLRVLSYLRHKGITDLPLWDIDVMAGAHRQEENRHVFTARCVPVLALSDDGPWLSQSLAILLHLEGRYPDTPALPTDETARGFVLELCAYVASDIQAVTNLRIRRHLKDRLGEAEALAWNAHWTQIGLDTLDTLVARSVGACAVGDAPTLADFFIWPALRNADRAGHDLSAHAHLGPLFQRYGQRDCFAGLIG